MMNLPVMDNQQQYELSRAQVRLCMSDGELLTLAREIAQEAGLQSLAELGYVETRELLYVLDVFERGEVGRRMRQRLQMV